MVHLGLGKCVSATLNLQDCEGLSCVQPTLGHAHTVNFEEYINSFILLCLSEVRFWGAGA